MIDIKKWFMLNARATNMLVLFTLIVSQRVVGSKSMLNLEQGDLNDINGNLSALILITLHKEDSKVEGTICTEPFWKKEISRRPRGTSLKSGKLKDASLVLL